MKGKGIFMFNKLNNIFNLIIQMFKAAFNFKIQYICFNKKGRSFAANTTRIKNSVYGNHKQNYENHAQELFNRYKIIKVHLLHSYRIGELIARAVYIRIYLKGNQEQGSLHIFIPDDYEKANKRLLTLLSRYFIVILPENVDFWAYMMKRYGEKFDIQQSTWLKFKERAPYSMIMNEDVIFSNLTALEMEEGISKTLRMGLNGDYVCIAARDSAYLKKTFRAMDSSYHDYRNTDIETFRESVDYLQQCNIKTVRMGKYVNTTFEHSNCIDYANKFYDEFLDIYLPYNCKFYLGDTSGIFLTGLLFGKPVLVSNACPLTAGWGCVPYNNLTIFLPVRYWNINKEEFLTFQEVFELEKYINWDYSKCGKLGIKLIYNSCEEIAEACKEMNQRIDGNWEDSLNDEDLQKQFRDQLKQWCEVNKKNYNEMIHFRIGSHFIRNNKNLLNNLLNNVIPRSE